MPRTRRQRDEEAKEEHREQLRGIAESIESVGEERSGAQQERERQQARGRAVAEELQQEHRVREEEREFANLVAVMR